MPYISPSNFLFGRPNLTSISVPSKTSSLHPSHNPREYNSFPPSSILPALPSTLQSNISSEILSAEIIKCIPCSNVQSPWMYQNSIVCKREAKQKNNCDKITWWGKKHYCRRSCFFSGYGYSDDN